MENMCALHFFSSYLAPIWILIEGLETVAHAHTRPLRRNMPNKRLRRILQHTLSLIRKPLSNQNPQNPIRTQTLLQQNLKSMHIITIKLPHRQNLLLTRQHIILTLNQISQRNIRLNSQNITMIRASKNNIPPPLKRPSNRILKQRATQHTTPYKLRTSLTTHI
jgi:hypothetical protein